MIICPEAKPPVVSILPHFQRSNAPVYGPLLFYQPSLLTMTRYLWLLLLCWPSLIVTAQDLSVWFERGHAAFEDGRYEEAERAFRWIVDQERKNAEGHYMLARVLLARDVPKKAARSITRAIKYDPDNVRYLEFQYQIGLPNEFIRPVRKVKKHELATKILALDAGSVTANVALGYSEAQVYLHHRNRITISMFLPYSNGFGRVREGRGVSGFFITLHHPR